MMMIRINNNTLFFQKKIDTSLNAFMNYLI